MEKNPLIDHPTISGEVFAPRKRKIPEKLEPNIKVLNFDISDNISIGGFFLEPRQKIQQFYCSTGTGRLLLIIKVYLKYFWDVM